MSQTAVAGERTHRAAKRYIYAFGGGQAEGNAGMRDLLGGKGAGLAEMTNAGLPVPPGFTITTEACNDYFGAGERLPDGLWDDVLEAVKRVEGGDRQGLRRCRESAPRERAVGRQVLHAGHDGHGPQPGPQRGHPARPDRPDRQRALRLGRLPALHPDVRAHRHGGARRSASTRCSTRPRRPTARSRTRTSTRRPSRRWRPRHASWSARSPAASSPATRWSSWTWPSRPSSPAGTASGPTTTASTTRSPTTWAPRSAS